MSYAQSERVQEISYALFGQRHRLAVMAAIAQSSDGRVNPSDLVKEHGFPSQSSFQKVFPGLVIAGLIKRVDGVDRRVYYERQPSAAWTLAIELLAKALAEDTPVPDTLA
ncbi:ArsR family transcriptional regulator [Mycobacteroides abscessus]|uniref:ArsR family transcriptional regulator n=1 Tax=Mycobacteroides abscessus TaxID=36809 RepID=UPI001F3E97DD|nr:ArsR family transcriptional regulator [Mycobacteroides abscessus]